MIDKYLYKQYILGLRSNSRIPKHLEEIIQRKQITDLPIEDQYKNIYLHELPNKRRIKNCYSSNYTVYDLFFSDYMTIRKIAKETKNKKIITKFLEDSFANKYDQSSSAEFLFNSLGSYTCDYCQTQIGYIFRGKNRKHYTGFLDHVFPMSKYPILSMSYGNLVCSCYTCNSILKNDKELVIEDINKICPPELFSLKIKKEAIPKIHQVKLQTNEFHIQVNKMSPYYLEVFKLEERVNAFKKYIRDYIYISKAFSNHHKRSIVTNVLGLDDVKSINYYTAISIYDSISNNEISDLLMSVKKAIDFDLDNLSAKNYL